MTIRNKFIVTCLMLIGIQLYAQDHKLAVDALTESERKSIEAIALYPKEIRLAVLEITTAPALMIQIKRMQETSQENFKNLLEARSQETQEIIWDLTRFDGLLEAIAKSDLSRPSLEAIVQLYPSVISEQIRKLQTSDFELIREVVHLRLETEETSRQLSRGEPESVQEALYLLLDHPDVLSILLDEVELAILVGNLYRTNKNWILEKADSLNLALAAENSRALEDWKSAIENDSQVQEELSASYREYQKEYPFDDVYYSPDESIPQGYNEEEGIFSDIPLYYHYHYPFWFGYPYWYDYPRWRPFPVWYDWGFYPYGHRRVIIIGLPRHHIVWWYFNRPDHHYRYNRLSTKFVQHYHGHREFGGSITSAVTQWRLQNRDVISDEFLGDREQLSDNLRLYGEMEEKRINYNRKNPAKPLTAREYMTKNNRKYDPIISKTETRQVEKQEVPQVRILRESERAPVKTRETKPATVDKKDEIRTIDKAREYHRNNWTKKPVDKSPAVKPAPSRTSPRSNQVNPTSKKTTPRKTQ